MGIADQFLDIFDGVGGGGAGAESRGADIKCVGTVIYGLATELQVLGRRQQFEFHAINNAK